MSEDRQIALPIPYASYTVETRLRTSSYSKWLTAYTAGRATWADKPIGDNLLLDGGQVVLLVSPGGRLAYRIPLVDQLYHDYLAAVAPDKRQAEYYTTRELTIQVAELTDRVSISSACHLVGERESPLSCLELRSLPLSGDIPETGVLKLYQLCSTDSTTETLRASWLLDVSGVDGRLAQATLVAPVVRAFETAMIQVYCQHLFSYVRPVTGECQLWSCPGGMGYLHHRRLPNGEWEPIPDDELLPPVSAVYLLEEEMWDRLPARPELVVVDRNRVDTEMLVGYQMLYDHGLRKVYRRSAAKGARQD